MPAPKYQATGTLQASTTTATPTWPTHLTNDIALLMVESAGGETISLSTSAGFAAVTNSPQTTGSTPAGTQIAVYWCRATSGAMSAPTVADPGDHVNAIIVTFRGCVTSGNPWDVTAGGVKASASTTGSATGLTTTVPDCLVVNCIARDNDLAAAAFSAPTNATLSGITELTGTDTGTALGGGGGFVMFAGTDTNPGTVNTTGFTVTSSINAYLTIALKGDTTPPAAGPPIVSPGLCLLRTNFSIADNTSITGLGWTESASGSDVRILSGALRIGADGLTGGYVETGAVYPATINTTAYTRQPLDTNWDIFVDVSTNSVTDEHYAMISVGDTNTGPGITSNGYTVPLGFGSTFVGVERRVAGTATDIATTNSFTWTANTTWRLHWKRRGNFHGIKLWDPVSGIMPTAWTVSGSDTTWRGLQNSVFLMGLLVGNLAVPVEILYRNVMISKPLQGWRRQP